ncbi:MAG: Ig-like domain-containing protein [Microbacteriaceae bacterium]
MKKTVALVSAGALAAALLSPLAAVPAQAAPPQTLWEWEVPGTYPLTVPTGVDELFVQMGGGSGGSRGGDGATVSGYITVTPGEAITAHVASAGGDGDTKFGSHGEAGTGYRNGGVGGDGSWYFAGVGNIGGYDGGGGGGASALVTSAGAVAIAAGGGGRGGSIFAFPFNMCTGTQGGNAGQNGAARAEGENACDDPGTPGTASTTPSGVGGAGSHGSLPATEGGGGGGGGGARGGTGGAHSSGGGAGGGGGSNLCELDACEIRSNVSQSDGWVTLQATYGTTTTLDASAYTVEVGSVARITGTVGYASGGIGLDKPQGTVTLTLNGLPIGSAPAGADGSFAFDCIAPCGAPTRSGTLRAEFRSPSQVWRTSNATAPIQFERLATLASVTATPSSGAPGDTVTLRAQVTPTKPVGPALVGWVAFYDSATDGTDQKLIGTAELDAAGAVEHPFVLSDDGDRLVWAEYGQSEFFASSVSAKRTITLAAASAQDTVTTVTLSPNPAFWQQPVSIVVDVSAGSGSDGVTGEVALLIDGARATATLVDGQAEFSRDDLAVGTHTIQADYLGTRNHTASSDTVDLEIVAARTVLSLSQTADHSVDGETVEFRVAAVAETAGIPVPGTVQLWVDGTASGLAAAVDASGSAMIPLAGLAPGVHSIQAIFSGTPTMLAAESNLLTHTVTVTPDAVTQVGLVSTADSVVFGSTVTLTATAIVAALPTRNATIAATAPAAGVVELHSNGVVLADAQPVDADGIVAFDLDSLPVGTHEIVAHFSGSAGHGDSTSAPVTVTVTLAPVGGGTGTDGSAMNGGTGGGQWAGHTGSGSKTGARASSKLAATGVDLTVPLAAGLLLLAAGLAIRRRAA